MSQRLHACMNGSHVDSLHNDPFTNRLRRGGGGGGSGKGEPQRAGYLNKRDRSATRNNPTILVPSMQQQNNVALSRNNRNAPAPPRSANLKSDPTATSVIHKEVYSDNNALVEVTVKTHNAKHSQHRSRSNSRTNNSIREPWDRLLKRKPSHENPSSFHYFDPLRTLHFLAKELQNKLLESLPNDTNILQMVQDMQHALQRIPPEVASTVQLLHNPPVETSSSKKASHTDLKPSKLRSHSKENIHGLDKLVQVVKPVTCDKSSQTIRTNYAEAEKLQKHLEESSAKIESACKQMETVCTRLKSEKEELEIMLTAERETVKFLRKQMEDFESEKAESTNAMIETLQAERENLQSQVKRLKSQIDMQQGPASQELRSLIQELRTQKSDADEQVELLNHQVTLLNMEKEKYVAILSARDRQIKEIRCEMNQLQEVVNEQLAELQNGQSSSVPSSITNMTNDQPSWLLIKPKGDSESKHEAIETVPVKGDDSTLRQLFMKDKLSSSREMQGDSSGTSSDNHKKRGKKERTYKRKPSPYKENVSAEHLTSNVASAFMAHSDTHANIRNMFAEIKKQAMLVTAPIVEAQKMNDMDVYHSEQSVPK